MGTIPRPRLSATPRLLRIGLLFVVACAVFPAMASAHNSLEQSNPVDGSVLTEAPAEWVLTFAEDVPLDSASGQVISTDGVRRELPYPRHGDSARVVRFALPADLTGTVSLRWRLVGTDGHVVSGRVRFTIDPATNPGTPTTTAPGTPDTTTDSGDGPTGSLEEPAGPAPEPVRWLIRTANFAALVLLGGLILSELHIARGTMSSPKGRRLSMGAVGAVAGTAVVQLLVILGDIHETSMVGALARLGDAFDSTPTAMAAVRVLSAVVLVAAVRSVATVVSSTRGTAALLGLGAIHLVALAYTGHSRSMAAPWLGIPVDVVHTAASAVWLGGLVALLVAVIPVLDSDGALTAFVRFGDAARLAVVAIVVTGLIQTARLHGGITTLFTQSHGRILLLKILIVALMLKVGDINRRRLVRIASASPSHMEQRTSLIVRASITEAALGAIVIAVTAMLVTASLG